MSARLIFVYNADAGWLAGAFDTVHKLVSPATYPCSLCALTHGTLTMDKRWRAYLKTVPLPVAFYHRADFRAAFPQAAALALPLVAVARNDHVEQLLGATDLDALITVDALMAAIVARLPRV